MSVRGPSQVEVLRDKLPAVADDPNKPRIPFKTALVLTREQEDALVDHVCTRMDQIEKQLGKISGSTGTGREFEVSCSPDSFFGKRQKYTARYYNHVEDRKTKATPGSKEDTIYNYSNLTASVSQRTVRQMIAKATSFLFGQPDDDEWFTAEGIGIEDETLADKVKKYARFVIKKNKIKPNHAQAVEFAFVRGEAVIKTTHSEIFQIFNREETYLIDAKENPILDAHGDYITAGDTWIPEQNQVPVASIPPDQQHLAILEEQQEPSNNPQEEGAEPQPEQMALVPTGRYLLKRDGVTVKPQQPIWKTGTITRRIVTFSGPDSRICHYLDLLVPLNATGLQAGEADLIAHLYDKSALQVAQMFRQQFEAGDEGLKNFQSAVDILTTMLAQSNAPKSAAAQPKRDFKEEDTDASQNNPQSEFAEIWGTYDCDGDGMEEEFFMVLDRRNRVPVFYEYTANVTLRGVRPFDVQRAIPIDGRWYGMGGMEYFETEQEPIDLMINRQSYRASKSGRVTLWRPYNTLEGDRDRNLRLNDGGTYTPKPGMKTEDVLTYVILPDDTSDVKETRDFMMQMIQVKAGVLTGADRNTSGMPSSQTLGEEQLITDSGDELFALYLMSLYNGEIAALSSVLDVLFSNIDRNQVFTYFNGDAHEILELTPDDVRDLSVNVRLSITRTRDKQTLEAGNVAEQVVDSYYQKPLPLQQRLTSFAQNRLKAMKVPRPETIIQPLDLQPQQPTQQPPQ
jgi:hypothetical protein